MKTKLLIIAGILAPLTLQAETGEQKEQPSAEEVQRALTEDIVDHDIDGDGKLSESEQEAALKESAERKAILEKHDTDMLAKYDIDKNGELDLREQEAAELDRFDADKDGVLDESEKLAAEKAALEIQYLREGRKAASEGESPEEAMKKEPVKEQ